MTIRSRAWCGALALSLLAPLVAAAQPPRNPFEDLFGRPTRQTGREFTAVQFRSTAGAQVGQTLEEEGLQVPGMLVPEGLSGAADASVILEFMRDRVQIAGQARYSYQEFLEPPAFGAPTVDVGFRADFKPTTRLGFHGGGNFSRSPFFQTLFLTAQQAGSLAPSDRSALLLMRNDSVQGSAGITSYYSKRSSLSLTGTVRETRFAQQQHSFSSIGGKAEWRRQMTRDVAFRAAYGREQLRPVTADGAELFTNELLDIGVDYGRALSLARRTSFSFGTETSMLRDQDGGRHFRLNGQVALQHDFLRTWNTQLSARRGTDFLPGFRAPVLTDHAKLSLNGYLAKRLLLNVGATGGRGEVGFNDDRQFISYSGDAKVTLAVTRHFGVFTQYLYYHYQNPPEAETLFQIPSGARQAVSFGVETWISLYSKDKVTRDPR